MLKGDVAGEASVQLLCMKTIYQTGQVCLQIAVHSYIGT